MYGFPYLVGSVKDYYKITRLSNAQICYVPPLVVKDYYKITRLSNNTQV